VSGTVNTSTLAIDVTISVLGINLGSFRGNLKDGLTINIDLIAAKGSVRFYLKNGNEVWLDLKLSVLFDGSYNTSVKLISI
jgi:hypothetical protein